MICPACGKEMYIDAQDGMTMIRYQRFFSGELIGIEFFRDYEEFVKKVTILDK